MSPTPSVTSPSTTAPSASSAAAAADVDADPLANEDTFLQLLVSQLQYQDPLNPVDSTTFVTQLTGYSQLEQLIDIDKNTTPATAATTDSNSTGGTDSTSSIANSTKTSGI
jgi:flagellar basal-body rod modification protein FlgD